MKEYKMALVALTLLIMLSPLGLLATGTAWGEWGEEELIKLLGYLPAGFSNLSDVNPVAFLPDYSLPLLEKYPLGEVVGYYLSAVVGVLSIFCVVFLLGRLIIGKK